MTDGNSNTLPMETIGMTEPEFETFKNLMLGVGVAYEMAPHTEAVMPQDREYDLSQYTKEIAKAASFINSLLAARLDLQAARIAELEARQMTPEINALVERYHHALNSDIVLFSRRSQRDYECAIGVLVIKLMKGDK